MKTLVFGDGSRDEKELANVAGECHYIDLRKGHHEVEVLMDLYESIHPEYIGTLREEILAYAPNRIVVIGRMEGYVWLGTIIARVFGQFNSWNGQRENPFGMTTLKVQSEDVPMFAIESLDDWETYVK